MQDLIRTPPDDGSRRERRGRKDARNRAQPCLLCGKFPCEAALRHPGEGRDPVRQTKSPPRGGVFMRDWATACAGVTEVAISAASAFSARNYSRQGPDTTRHPSTSSQVSGFWYARHTPFRLSLSKPVCSACAGGTDHVITAPSRNYPVRPRLPCRPCRRERACPLPGRLRCPGCGSSRSSAATSCPGFRLRRRRNR